MLSLALQVKSSLVELSSFLPLMIIYLLQFIHLKLKQTFTGNDFFRQSNSNHAYLLEELFTQTLLLKDAQTRSLHLINLKQIALLTDLLASNCETVELRKFLSLELAGTLFKVKLASLNI